MPRSGFYAARCRQTRLGLLDIELAARGLHDHHEGRAHQLPHRATIRLLSQPGLSEPGARPSRGNGVETMRISGFSGSRASSDRAPLWSCCWSSSCWTRSGAGGSLWALAPRWCASLIRTMHVPQHVPGFARQASAVSQSSPLDEVLGMGRDDDAQQAGVVGSGEVILCFFSRDHKNFTACSSMMSRYGKCLSGVWLLKYKLCSMCFRLEMLARSSRT